MKKNDRKSVDRAIRGALLEDIEWVTTLVAAQWKKIMVAGVVIVVAVGVFYSFSLEAQRKERKAANALAAAQSIDDLAKALETYPDSANSNFARLRLARLYVEKKDFDSARKQLAAVSAAGDSDEVLSRVRLDEIYIKELSGDKAGAAAAFEAVAGTMVDPSMRSEAYYSAGRIRMDLGDVEAARNALSRASAVSGNEDIGAFQGLSQALLLSLDAQK